jgi:integrase
LIVIPRKTFRLKITSPELIEQINPENKKLVAKFIKNFKTKRSSGSVTTYESNYNIFFCWNLLENDNKFFNDIKKSELMDFFDYGVEELHWSPNRYAQMHSSLSSFSTYILNILDDVYPDFKAHIQKIDKLIKENVREKSIFTKEELDKLLLWLDKQGLIQEKCLLRLIMSSGARISELLRINMDMIDLDNVAFEGLFLETKKEIVVKGRGVYGKKIYRYLIKDLFEPYYLEWTPIRKKIMKENNQEHNSLFIKRDGSPATVSVLRTWMSKWGEILGKPWYPHSGRHFWTTYLLALGCEQEFVQDLQKWSTSSMVAIYNDATAKDREWKGLAKLKLHLDNEKEDAIVIREDTDDANDAFV